MRVDRNTHVIVRYQQLKAATLLFDNVVTCFRHDEYLSNSDEHARILSLLAENNISHNVTVFVKTESFPQIFERFPNSVLLLSEPIHEEVTHKTELDGAYTAALSSLPIPVLDRCEWAQVIDFRKDQEAIWKYRKLHSWLSSALKSKSHNEARDIIEQSLEDYAWSIRKHAISTTIGSLKSIVQPESIASASALIALGQVLERPDIATISAGLVLTSRAALTIAEYLTERRAVFRGPGSECALLYEIRENFP